MMNVFLF